jgi:RNA polymerase sigma-70 factor, ECF subfamily
MVKNLEYTDAEIIDLVLSGDIGAYGDLVDHYKSLAYSVAYKYTKNEEDAADRVQDGFVKAYTSLRNLKDRDKFSHWFYRIVSNECLNWLRGRRVNAFLVEDMEDVLRHNPILAASGPGSAADDLMQADLKKMVQRAIESLPEKYKIVIYLRYFEDHSYQEIAGFLDLPISTVDGRIRRAKGFIRKKLMGLSHGEVVQK